MHWRSTGHLTETTITLPHYRLDPLKWHKFLGHPAQNFILSSQEHNQQLLLLSFAALGVLHTCPATLLIPTMQWVSVLSLQGNVSETRLERPLSDRAPRGL